MGVAPQVEFSQVRSTQGPESGQSSTVAQHVGSSVLSSLLQADVSGSHRSMVQLFSSSQALSSVQQFAMVVLVQAPS
tara:strand:- start:1594 stop:1824 length:231 start_codon:yes stop_codon:yes gene_type:complete